MGLSRLDNFLKSTRGEILYVDPSSIDSTDSVENKGNSLTRPFKTLQRALIEAARFSYQGGDKNDRFEKTTILLYPGEHIIDNRPGWIPDGSNNYKLRDGTTSNLFSPLDLDTNFNLTSPTNALYKFNSIRGGVIIPRGVSVVGLDLRKTKIKPKYVPDPENDDIERTAIFRVTGACYMNNFSVFDGDPAGIVYKDYTTNTFVPNFSHHKLTVFEYADGVNSVEIDDAFISNYSTTRTDLDMYYEKIGLAYGPSSGREIFPDYPSGSLDIQPKVDEFRIVGSQGSEVGITSIKAGDGTNTSTTITVNINDEIVDLDVNTPIQIQGIGPTGYNGQFVISAITGTKEFQYRVQNAPSNPRPTSVGGATVNLVVDTVTSASPYIFSVSLRSVYGMCGMWADGSKATGFKSMVVAQFTGISLQKDDNAFIKYNSDTGIYEGKNAVGNSNIHTNSRAVYKPDWVNWHIRASNNSIIQIVSVFAIGYARHFYVDSGGDFSITNSNSNFGNTSLYSSGFRDSAFGRDDVGYITHIIPPKVIDDVETTSEFSSIDVARTIGVGNSTRLYLYTENNQNVVPTYIVDGYRIGAKDNDSLNVLLSSSGITSTYSAKIVMPNTQNTANEVSKEKVFYVDRSGSLNNINTNTFVINLTTNHTFINGEKIRVISSTGQLPDGIQPNQVYYAITSSSSFITPNQIKLAQTFNDALNDKPIRINNKGGVLKIVSRVSDKTPVDVGHPIVWDSAAGQWYINVAAATTSNTIYNAIVGFGTVILGNATPRTFITRTPDTRNLTDSIYRIRYVIPASSSITARPPLDGFILEETNTTLANTSSEIQKYFSTTSIDLSNSTELRNFKIIANATWSSNQATITTELPHNFSVGDEVKITNIKSSSNVDGADNTGFNGTFTITSVLSKKKFVYSVTIDPGTFQSDTSLRTTSLPKVSRKKLNGIYTLYRTQEIQKYIKGEQDGIYHVILINSSNSPTVQEFSSYKFSQPIQNLYPQSNRDDPQSDPQSSVSFALPNPIGQVIVNDPQASITRETTHSLLRDFNVGLGITNIVSNPTGTAHTIFTKLDHGFNRVVNVNIIDTGSNYGTGSGSTETFYNARLQSELGSGFGEEATARVTVNSSGQIINIKIMDGGSSYGIGNTFAIVGIATTTNHHRGVVEVSQTYSNIGDNLSLEGIIDRSYSQYNGNYRITGISVGDSKKIEVQSVSAISSPAVSGISSIVLTNTNLYLTGKSVLATSLEYDNVSGVATVFTSNPHGLRRNNRLVISGANSSIFNGSFVIDRTVGISTIIFNVGSSDAPVATTGTIYVNNEGYNSRGGFVSRDEENTAGRMIVEYGNLTAFLSSAITSLSTDEVYITSINIYDFQIGDYIQIDDEIMRIKSTVPTSPGSPLKVFRGILGTKTSSHVNGSCVKRIKVYPIELRRHSIIRASSHTFEYIGYGPGNYSTALPDNQDRQITAQEEFLSQALKESGGTVVFTGMNSDGDFYTGNKKINASTGQEEVFDAPIPTVVGEDLSEGSSSLGFDIMSPLEVSVSRSLRVEGGPNNNIISEFDGPVIFNNKITSNSLQGIESNSLFLQGDARISRKYTVGISTPVFSGNPGDVIFRSNPLAGGTIGWVYTDQNDWYQFGNISLVKNSNVGLFDQIGIAVTTPEDYLVRVSYGSSAFTIDNTGHVGICTTSSPVYALNVNGVIYGDGSGLYNVSDIWEGDAVGVHTTTKVGVGTTSARAEYGLYVEGSAAFNGSLRVYEIIEKATISSGILSSTSPVNIDLGDNNVYYYTNNAQGNWGINFRGGAGLALTSFLNAGDSMTVAILTTQGATPYYNNSVRIDNVSITPKYYGGSQITSGNANGIDTYTYVIIRKGSTGNPSNDFTILYSQSQYS